MQIRFQFQRGEELKFIGHLDILRLFERAFKRTELPVAYSKGYNPRPQIVFGQPMPLGLTSDGEFADIELIGNHNPEEIICKINSSLPPGIRVVYAREKINRSNLMGLIDAARYRIGFEAYKEFDINQMIENIQNSSVINVVKKTKSGEKEMNIRPFIYDLSGNADGGTGCFSVMLGAGQDNNIRPELFLTGLSLLSGIEFEIRSMHRLMLYSRREIKSGSAPLQTYNIWVSLMDDTLL